MTDDNRPAGYDPAEVDVLRRFLLTARRDPDAVAVIDDTSTVSYGELELRVRRIAARLGPDCGTVAVLTSRSADTVAALLGVLAAGGTYCPIDPAFPLERKTALLAAAGVRSAIAADPGRLPAGVPVLDPSEAVGTEQPEAFPAGWLPEPDPAAPAYLLFTSGSTGQPKPVVTPRRAIGASVASLATLFAVAPGDRVLQFASLNWDTCFEEILPALTVGATLVFDADAYSASFPRFLRMVERHRITLVDLPTAFWHEFVNHLTEERDLTEERAALPESLRTVVIGGEAARPARIDDWCALPGADAVRLVNTYGCTETTLVTHAIDLHGPFAAPALAPEAGRVVPIGRALPHVREQLSEEGELLIGGDGLALGYRGLPEVTAERFAELDLPGAPGRYFRTGDRVRREPDGVLVHQGRLDDELKVRGIRVSPGEVEAQICAHPDVAAAAATGAALGDHTVLVAYVTPRPHADTDTLAAGLARYLRQSGPSHLVPSRITVVPELVLTASGKVDRRRTHQMYATSN
ncbi:amino acid adenylation domain-containing protein [Kitasatospora sp. NPDC028055]|uniref:amino acid adenylation domain-containing protein n=1 Tax=Kitasatospora sp. NPDC028055 TaxID=3155653 RepID=UPI0033CEA4C7